MVWREQLIFLIAFLMLRLCFYVAEFAGPKGFYLLSFGFGAIPMMFSPTYNIKYKHHFSHVKNEQNVVPLFLKKNIFDVYSTDVAHLIKNLVDNY
jgi:hypothetical protein